MILSHRRTVVAAIIALVFSFAAVPHSFAGEKKVEINTSYSIKQILSSFTGQRVSLKTGSGDTMEGTVTSVGDHLVHISRLTGRDYYDAVVVIDRIDSVVFRAKGN